MLVTVKTHKKNLLVHFISHILFFRFLGNQTTKTRELEEDEASGGNGGIEQDAEVSSGGSGQTVPPQALQSLRQANLEVHGPRRARPVQHRRPRKLFLNQNSKNTFLID